MRKRRFFQFLILLTMLALPILANAQAIPSPDQPCQQYTQALYLIGSHHYDQAMKTLVRIIGQCPSASEAYLKIAMLYSRNNELEKASLFFAKLLMKNPKNASAYRALGWIEFKKRRYKKSAEMCWQAIQLKPDCAVCFKDYLDAMQKLGNLDEAERSLKSWKSTHPKSAAIYYALGYLDQLQKNWKNGLANLDRSLRLNANLFEAYTAKGVILYFEGDYPNLLKTSRIALNRATRENNLEAQCHFLGNIGLAYFSMGNFHRALNDNGRALELAQKIGSRNEAIRILNNMGTANRNLGKMDAALTNFKEALKLARNPGNRRQEGLLLRNIGSAYRLMDNYSRALFYFNRSLPILREVGEKRREGLVYWSLSLTHWNFGNYPKALALSKKAFTIAQRIGDKWGEERYGGTIGLINWNLGRYSRAFDQYEKALALSRKIGDRVGEELWLGNMAELFDELGDLSRALDYYNKALLIAKEIGNRRGEARQIGNMATLYQKMEDNEKALKYYDQALKIEEEIGNKREQTAFLNDAATLYEKSGHYEKSKKRLQKALRIAKGIHSKKSEGNCYIGLGALYFSMKNDSLTLKNYKSALRIGKGTHNVGMVWEADAGLGRVYSRSKQFKKSLGYFEKAIRAIEKMRATIPTEEYRTGFLETKLAVYDRVFHVLSELHRRFPSAGYDRKSFQLVEGAKARSLLDLVYQGRVFQILKEIPPDFREQFLINEKQLSDGYRDLSDELTKPQDKQDEERIERLGNEIDSLKRAKSRVTAALRQKYPRYFDLTNPTLLTVRDVRRKILKKNQILIEYWVGQDETYLWAIGKNRLLFKSIDLSREALQKRLAKISPLFSPKKVSEEVTMDHRWANINPELLQELYRDILEKPAGPVFKGADQLLIIPDDLLFYVPFELLVTKIEKGAAHYLIEDFPISYAASSSLLNPKLRKAGTAKKDLLAFGNPDFSGARENEAATPFSVPSNYRSILRNNRFQPLPDAELEVKAIAKNFKSASVFTGRQATERRFKRMAGAYRLIHLATHFVIDDDHPMQSKIILARSPDKKEDGFLHMYELYNLRLHAQMIVLSGCNSGLGKLRRGEGLISLTRAFLFAGVPDIVVSLWPVEDRSTAQLMQNFYFNLKKGFSKARALQEAKINLIKSNTKARDSFYWAPFILIEE